MSNISSVSTSSSTSSSSSSSSVVSPMNSPRSLALTDEWSPEANCLLSGRIMSALKAALLSDPISAEQLIHKISAVFCISVYQSNRVPNIDVCWLIDLEKFPGAFYESKSTEAAQWKVTPRTTFRLTDEIFREIAVGKLNPMWAVMQGKAGVSGDLMKALAFHQHVFKLPQMLALRTMDLTKPFTSKTLENAQNPNPVLETAVQATPPAAAASSGTLPIDNNLESKSTTSAGGVSSSSQSLSVNSQLPLFTNSVLSGLSPASSGQIISKKRKLVAEEEIDTSANNSLIVSSSSNSNSTSSNGNGNGSGVVDEPFIEKLSNFSDEEKQQIKNLLKLDAQNVVPLGTTDDESIRQQQKEIEEDERELAAATATAAAAAAAIAAAVASLTAEDEFDEDEDGEEGDESDEAVEGEEEEDEESESDKEESKDHSMDLQQQSAKRKRESDSPLLSSEKDVTTAVQSDEIPKEKKAKIEEGSKQ